MNHDRTRGRRSGVTVLAPASALQPVRTITEGAQGVAATLICCSRIVFTHRGGHGVQAAIEGGAAATRMPTAATTNSSNTLSELPRLPRIYQADLALRMHRDSGITRDPKGCLPVPPRLG